MFEKQSNSDSDKILLEALREEPGFLLSDAFADRLADKISRRFEWKQYIREFLVYLAAGLGILGLSAGMALIWFEIDWLRWGNFLLSNIGIVAAAIVLAVFVLFADRVLLRYFLFRNSTE